MYPPRQWLEKWTAEHPRLAALMLVWGLVMIGFVVWLVVADWKLTTL